MRGLFDRLEGGARELRELPSVLAHLEALLNAREGSFEADPEFGRPDLTSLVHAWPEGVRSIERLLQERIARFEPRLVAIEVRALALDPGLAFSVRARLARAPQTRVCLRTSLDAAGHFVVRQ